MFHRKTLFILGAGASHEVGLPMGRALADDIAVRLDVKFRHGFEPISGDQGLYGLFQQRYPQERQQYQAAAWRIRDGVRFSSSIDDFLDIHSADEKLQLIGKSAIVRSILNAERSSAMYFDLNQSQQMDFSKIEQTWYLKFMRMLGRGNKVGKLFDNVSFIVFNYDRCLEHFLFNAIPKLFAVSEEDVKSIMADVNIIHPYGTVGNIKYGFSGRGIPFGGSTVGFQDDYIALAANVRTYTEQNVDAKLTALIAQEVSTAECLVFLGFGYHTQNMALLKPLKGTQRAPIYATGLGLSSHDAGVVCSQLEGMSIGRGPAEATIATWVVVDKDATCASLFDDYGKSITGASR